MTDVVIPVKELSEAKRRLQTVLIPDQRASLVLAMLHDMLSTLQFCDLGSIWLVAADDEVLDLGAEFGTQPIRETASQGYNFAVSTGLRAVKAESSVIVLPADLPLIELADIDRLISLCARGSQAVGIVPDRHNRGTNGLYLSQPGLIKPAFGASSFFDHKAAATLIGVASTVVYSTNMAMDIDSADDLSRFAQSAKFGATAEILRSISLDKPPAKQHLWGVA
jgi:2-phospho-L-lactate guanylyltransferase